jgi:hypothetical protein
MREKNQNYLPPDTEHNTLINTMNFEDFINPNISKIAYTTTLPKHYWREGVSIRCNMPIQFCLISSPS